MNGAALGKVFGVTKQSVSQWEKDIDIPGTERLALLRRTLRVTYSWLLEGTGPPPDPNAPEVLLDDLVGEDQEAVRAGLAAMVDVLHKRKAS